MLIIPTLWSYLRELECSQLYLAYCISIYALGEIIGTYLASTTNNRHNTKLLLILSMFCGILGGFIYGSAALMKHYYSGYCGTYFLFFCPFAK